MQFSQEQFTWKVVLQLCCGTMSAKENYIATFPTANVNLAVHKIEKVQHIHCLDCVNLQ